MQTDEPKVDENIEMWRMKKMIKMLENARGNGTSMITLLLPPKEQIGKISQKLTEEYGTAANIKSRVNRQSVMSAIVSAQQKLKLYTRIPKNGLVIFCGTILSEDGKERKIGIDFEPFRPLGTYLYLCDNVFHPEALYSMIEDEERFGFIVVDGHGALFGMISGNTRDVLRKFSVDLPKKHGRGGQSSVRFARLRVEKRLAYIKKVAETANSLYLVNEKINCSGIVLAGSADFKTELKTLDAFDSRLRERIIATVDVSYGGESGFNQAIELSSGSLSNLKFVKEKKILDGYFTALSTDTDKIAVGCQETLSALELGAVDLLIIWEGLEIQRIVTKEEEKILYLEKNDEIEGEAEIVESCLLVDWISEKYMQYGAKLFLVSDKTAEGAQFCQGLGGIGAHLRYSICPD